MLNEILFENRPQVLLEKMLDKASLNQKVISSNIANIGTPGYARRGVSFEEKLKSGITAGFK